MSTSVKLPQITPIRQNESADKISAALKAARAGSGSLPQLAEAYELASLHNLSATKMELSGYLQSRLPVNIDRKKAVSGLAKAFGIGVIAGLTTHFVLVSMGERK